MALFTQRIDQVFGSGSSSTATMGACHCFLALLFGVVLTIQAHGQNLNVDKLQGSCYTGLAVLRLKTAASNCQDRARDTRPLTAPMDLATDLPWDCMESLVVSVEGCKVSIIPMRNASALLPGFSCNWLEYRGYVDSTTSAQLAAWTRPISAARWVLYNTNLTSWRQQGVGTVSIGSLVRALEHVQRRDPNLPISQLMRQQELVALLKNYRNFNMQLDADEAADEAAAPGQQQMQQPLAPGDIRLGKKLLQYNKHQSASAAGGGREPAPAPAEQPVPQPAAVPPPATPAAAPKARDPADMPIVAQQPAAQAQQPAAKAQQPAEEHPWSKYFDGPAAKPAEAPAEAAAAAAAAKTQPVAEQEPAGPDPRAKFFVDPPANAATAPAPAGGAAGAAAGTQPAAHQQPDSSAKAGAGPAPAAAQQAAEADPRSQFFIEPPAKAAAAPAPAAAGKPAGKEPELVVDPPVFTADRPQGLPAAVAEVAEAAAAQAAAEAKPVQSDKPVLPPGVEADVGTGLVSSPVEWQKKLADMFNGNGSLLHADVPNNIIVLFHNRRCNLTYEIVSGGLLTLGEVDRSTVGKLAMPAIEPFREPYVLEVQPDALAQAASGSSGGWLGLGDMFGPQSKSAKVSMVVIIAVLGAVLLGAVMCLCVRLARAGKHRHEYVRGSVFDDGVGVRPVSGGRLSQRQPGATAGMSRLERHAQSLRETGQSTAHSSSIIPCLTWRRRK